MHVVNPLGRVLIAQFVFLLPGFLSEKRKRSLAFEGASFASLRALVVGTLSVIAVLAGLVSLYRSPFHVIRPFRPGPRIIRAGIWTVHFGMDNEGRDSQRAMQDLIR